MLAQWLAAGCVLITACAGGETKRLDPALDRDPTQTDHQTPVDTPFRITAQEYPALDGSVWMLRGAGFGARVQIVPVWAQVYPSELQPFDKPDCHIKSFVFDAVELEGGTWLLFQDASACGQARCAWVEPALGKLSEPSACPSIISFIDRPRHLAGELYELATRHEGGTTVAVVRWRRGGDPVELFPGFLDGGDRRLELRGEQVHVWLPSSCDPSRGGCDVAKDYAGVPSAHWRWAADTRWQRLVDSAGD